jgi:hypothetical protein
MTTKYFTMQRRNFFNKLGTGALATGITMPLWAAPVKGQAGPVNPAESIQHMVIFDLKHAKGSEAEAKFLADGKRILTHIPVVRDFRVLDQVSLKNDYHFGFSMFFANRTDYETYNNHPDHVAFVENRWKKEVTRFLEIDFKAH